jgi:hypothetical protein
MVSLAALVSLAAETAFCVRFAELGGCIGTGRARRFGRPPPPLFAAGCLLTAALACRFSSANRIFSAVSASLVIDSE